MSEILRYLELKSGASDHGPAWIGYVKTSHSSQMIYFNGRALQKIALGCYQDEETGEFYWVSRIGNGKGIPERNRLGGRKVMIETRAAQEFMALAGLDRLDSSRFTLIQLLAREAPETAAYRRELAKA